MSEGLTYRKMTGVSCQKAQAGEDWTSFGMDQLQIEPNWTDGHSRKLEYRLAQPIQLNIQFQIYQSMIKELVVQSEESLLDQTKNSSPNKMGSFTQIQLRLTCWLLHFFSPSSPPPRLYCLLSALMHSSFFFPFGSLLFSFLGVESLSFICPLISSPIIQLHLFAS